MHKIILISALVLIACNNNSDSSSGRDTTKKDSAKVTSSWTKEERNEFLADCVGNAKQTVREDTAYMRCNCVLKQIERKYPTLDSASAALIDSSSASEFLRNCR